MFLIKNIIIMQSIGFMHKIQTIEDTLLFINDKKYKEYSVFETDPYWVIPFAIKNNNDKILSNKLNEVYEQLQDKQNHLKFWLNLCESELTRSIIRLKMT